MKFHIRFRKSFESYRQGESYRLPVELADIYLKAGVAEIVDHVPPVAAAAVTTPEEPVEETEQASDADDGDTTEQKPKRKR